MSESQSSRQSSGQAPAVPPGFRVIHVESPFIHRNGPIYARRDDDGLLFGCRITRDHCNPLGICHGGWLATLSDMVLPFTGRVLGGLADRHLLTVHLDVDYLAAVPQGAWVEGRARLLRRTPRMLFIDGLLDVDGEAVLRASGVFRIGPQTAPIVID